MNIVLSIFGLTFLGSVAGLSGGLLLLWKENIAKRFSIYLVSFAAGVTLTAALMDLLPEAFALSGSSAFTLTLVGLVMFFLVEDFLLHFHHHEGHEHSLKSVAPLIVVGDSIHNFIDGVVIAASFIADPRLGVFVALATFFHEIPQEIGDFAVLLSSGMDKVKVIIYNLVSACATFFGAILTLFVAGGTTTLVGPLLGLAAGMFLYIACADILPQIVHGGKGKERWAIAGSFILGIVLLMALGKVVPE